MKLIVIDTETSDLDPTNGAAILELAWMVLDNNDDKWVIRSAYETYVQYDGPISPKAQASHHIRSDCLRAPRAIPRKEAVEKLLFELDNAAYAVAHNAAFDSQFLPEVANGWICTYRASKKIWPSAPGHSNQVLRYWMNIIPDLSSAPTVKARAPHQALYDVATTTGILLKMLETRTPSELYALNQPQILENIAFGKHKGMAFKAIPRDYLVWLGDQANLDEDVRFTINSILRP